MKAPLSILSSHSAFTSIVAFEGPNGAVRVTAQSTNPKEGPWTATLSHEGLKRVVTFTNIHGTRIDIQLEVCASMNTTSPLYLTRDTITTDVVFIPTKALGALLS